MKISNGMKKLALASLLAFLLPSLAFAQSQNQPVSSLDLQKQIQDLLQQIQVLQQQVSTLQAELGKEPEKATTAAAPTEAGETPATASESASKPEPIPPNLTRTLSRGSSGDDVRKLQEFLSQDKDIYPAGLITGFFGPATESAVKRWQSKHGIESIGNVGPKTLAKINELLNSSFTKDSEDKEGSGRSGIIPQGFLYAPGLQKIQVDATTTPSLPSTISTTTAATIATTTIQITSITSKDFVPGELLFKFKEDIPVIEQDTLLKGLGLVIKEEIKQIKVKVVTVPEEAKDKIILALSHNPKIEFAEKNFLATGGILPNDPDYSRQWHLPKISAPAAWDISTGNPQTVLAVIDSGVDPAHPDLSSKLSPGFSHLKNSTDTRDTNGHGTAVTGAAAAVSNNLTGVTAVSWQNSILPLAVSSSGGFASYYNIASAITYAADHNAKVINISMGGRYYSSTLQDAINYAWDKKVVIVASAMNNSTSTPMYPAALKNVVAVSATDSSDNLANFSNYGDWIDLSAPGVNILTTDNGGGYGYWSGTSFSSPIVAALATLAFSANPSLTNAQVVDLMKQNADDLGTHGFDKYYGYGRVNAHKTILAAFGNTTTPVQPISQVPIQPVPQTATTIITTDITPPVISNIQTSNITETSTNVTWITDESAGSEVYYYGSSPLFATTTPPKATGSDAVTSHSVNLANLSSSRTYYYVVVSKDAAGNTASSSEQSFTTLTPPPPPPPPINQTLYIEVKDDASINDINSDGIGDRMDTLNGGRELQTNSGNPAVGEYRTVFEFDIGKLASSADIKLEYMITQSGGDYRLYEIPGDGQVTIGDYNSSGTLLFSLSARELLVKTIDINNVIQSALSAGKRYVAFRLQGSGGAISSSEGSALLDGYLSFWIPPRLTYTPPMPLPGQDVTPPTISNVSASAITASQSTVSWNTNEPASSVLYYAPNNAQIPIITIRESGLSTNHTATLSNLTPQTTYYYRIKAYDSQDNVGVMASRGSFTTLTTVSFDSRAKNLAAISQTLDAIREKLIKLLQGL